jgi:hypothetical protein
MPALTAARPTIAPLSPRGASPLLSSSASSVPTQSLLATSRVVQVRACVKFVRDLTLARVRAGVCCVASTTTASRAAAVTACKCHESAVITSIYAARTGKHDDDDGFVIGVDVDAQWCVVGQGCRREGAPTQ